MFPSLRRIAVATLGVVAAGVLLANPTLADSDGDGDGQKSSTSTGSSTTSVTSGSTNSSDASGQSTFVVQDRVAFGLTVPEIRYDDFFFTIRAPIGISWAAIGIGSEKMEGALVLMIYMNDKGDNVTFSPRASKGTYEPEYYPGFKYTILNAGLYDNHMLFSARCTEGCQSWPGGYMDVSSSNVPAIYATGPYEGFSSSNPAASVKYHSMWGSFTIDTKRTFGNADAPTLDNNSVTSGASSEGEEASGKQDYKSIFHAVIMIGVYLGLMPLGVLLLRVGHWVRWHGVNQFLAMVGVFAGTLLGILTSLLYQRSRGFNSAHQILGLVLTVFVIIQFLLGFFHHRAYKKTQKTTKMAPVHVWLGRLILVLATVTAFLGFPLALKPNKNYILAGVVVLVFLVMTGALLGRKVIDKVLGRKSKSAHNQEAPGYDPEPWRHQDTQNGGYGGYGGYGGEQHEMR